MFGLEGVGVFGSGGILGGAGRSPGRTDAPGWPRLGAGFCTGKSGSGGMFGGCGRVAGRAGDLGLASGWKSPSLALPDASSRLTVCPICRCRPARQGLAIRTWRNELVFAIAFDSGI